MANFFGHASAKIISEGQRTTRSQACCFLRFPKAFGLTRVQRHLQYKTRLRMRILGWQGTTTSPPGTSAALQRPHGMWQVSSRSTAEASCGMCSVTAALF